MTMSINGTSGITFPDGTTQATAAASEFASGTKLLFQQTSAPTGWTKSTSYDNYAMRLVSGSVSSGGSVAFTTAFASQTPAGSVSGTVGSTTLDITQIPSHTHGVTDPGHTHSYATASSKGLSSGGDPNGVWGGGDHGNNATTTSAATGISVSNTGGGGSHTHSFSGSFSGTAINLAVQYLDFILATKN